MLFAVLVVESSFELCITIRAASGFARLSSIQRCPSGRSSSSSSSSSRSPGASNVFMFLVVGSMIVISPTTMTNFYFHDA